MAMKDQEDDNAWKDSARTPLLAFRNITVMRGAKRVLDRFTLDIGSGENVAIIGPNGCGKSTLIKTISRELYPLASDGSFVRLLGQDRWNIFDLRSHLGLVSNDLMASHTRDFTGRETILSGFFGSVGIWPHHVVTPEMQERVDQIITLLEIENLAERPVSEMSSGEAKRTLIGRALVHRPSALLLDEPTNSLDLRAMQEIREVLRKLVRSGTSLVLVTHHLPDIIPEMRRVILLRDGQVFADGPKEDVLSGEVLSAVFGIPMEIIERNGYFHVL
jgi:iron complex transport system ATP-binding protein